MKPEKGEEATIELGNQALPRYVACQLHLIIVRSLLVSVMLGAAQLCIGLSGRRDSTEVNVAVNKLWMLERR